MLRLGSLHGLPFDQHAVAASGAVTGEVMGGEGMQWCGHQSVAKVMRKRFGDSRGGLGLFASVTGESDGLRHGICCSGGSCCTFLLP